MLRNYFCFTVCLGLCFLQAGCSGFLFYPTKDWQYDPKKQGYDYQSISIEADDGVQLNAWLMPHKAEARKGAVLYFHGNAQNIGSHVAQVFWLTDEGYDVLLVDYRGFGHSEGEVNIHKNIIDIGTAMQYFFEQYPDERKYLLGQSIGAAMSGYVLATQPQLCKQFEAVALDSGFAEYGRITRDVLNGSWVTWAFQYPISWTMPGQYDLLPVIDHIAPTPLLIVHGKKDTLVSFDHAEDLFARAGRPKSFLWFDGPHIGAFLDANNRKALVNFYQYGVLQPEKEALEHGALAP